MNTQHLDDFFDRLELRAHGPSTPVVQKSPCPDRILIAPEGAEIFLAQICPDGLVANSQQLLKVDHLLVRQIFRALEKAPATAGQLRLFPLGFRSLASVVRTMSMALSKWFMNCTRFRIDLIPLAMDFLVDLHNAKENSGMLYCPRLGGSVELLNFES